MKLILELIHGKIKKIIQTDTIYIWGMNYNYSNYIPHTFTEQWVRLWIKDTENLTFIEFLSARHCSKSTHVNSFNSFILYWRLRAELFNPKLWLPINYKRKALFKIHNADQWYCLLHFIPSLHLLHNIAISKYLKVAFNFRIFLFQVEKKLACSLL